MRPTPPDSLLTLSADMNSGPICAMVWEGLDAVKTGRGKPHFPSAAPFPLPRQLLADTAISSVMLGATNPLASAPGTIRGDYWYVSFVLARLVPPNCVSGGRGDTKMAAQPMSLLPHSP